MDFANPENVDNIDMVLNHIKSADDFTSIDCGEVWYDDHLPCITAIINGFEFDMYYINLELVGAFKYAHESEQARYDIFAELQEKIKENIEAFFEREVEEIEENFASSPNLLGVLLDYVRNNTDVEWAAHIKMLTKDVPCINSDTLYPI